MRSPWFQTLLLYRLCQVLPFLSPGFPIKCKHFGHPWSTCHKSMILGRNSYWWSLMSQWERYLLFYWLIDFLEFVCTQPLLQCADLSSSVRAELPHGVWDLSSLTRGRTCNPYFGRQILNQWIPREVQEIYFRMPFSASAHNHKRPAHFQIRLRLKENPW